MVRPASRVSRVLMTGPLAPFADAYALELKQRCYTPLTSVNQLRQVARLSSWLEVRGLGVAELTGERVEEFLAFQRAAGRQRAQWSRPGLLCLLDVLQRLGVRAAEDPVQAARRRMRCWAPSSVTCSPSAAWRLAPLVATCVTQPGSWPGCRPAALPT